MTRRANEFLRVAVVALLAVLLALGLARTSWHHALENAYCDWWHVLSGVRYEPRHTAMVAVDDETLAALKDDPLAFWAPHFGSAIDVLSQAGASAVGLDFLYQVSAEGWLKKLDLPESDLSRSYDAPLRAALSKGNAVLITHLVTRKDGAELLVPPADQLVMLPRGIHDLGVANVFPDEDKHVRHFLAAVDQDPKKPSLGFALQLALRAAGKGPAGAEWEIAGARLTREPRGLRIGFAGQPGTVPVLSMMALLAPGALAGPVVQALKGRAVILAAANAGTPDRHITPYARRRRRVVDLHANIVETILSGRYPRELPLALGIAYLADDSPAELRPS